MTFYSEIINLGNGWALVDKLPVHFCEVCNCLFRVEKNKFEKPAVVSMSLEGAVYAHDSCWEKKRKK